MSQILSNSMHFLKNVSKCSFLYTNRTWLRNYSRRVNSPDSSYKWVHPRKIVKGTCVLINNYKSQTIISDASNLVWRDPNFELLASKGFPLFLRGHIGVAWYDSQTTIKTSNELIMEQMDDVIISCKNLK